MRTIWREMNEQKEKDKKKRKIEKQKNKAVGYMCIIEVWCLCVNCYEQIGASALKAPAKPCVSRVTIGDSSDARSCKTFS